MRRSLVASGILLSLFASTIPSGVLFAANSIQGSPRILNLYLNWQLREEDLPTLARWDAVVLDADQQTRYPERLRKLRVLNPSIKLLAYVPSEEIAAARFSEPIEYPFGKQAKDIQDAWYLKDPQGNRTEFWPGSSLLNVTDKGPAGPTGERWNEYLPRFIRDEVLSTKLWDGVFLDNTFDAVSWFVKSPVDLDRDGVAESKSALDAAWRDGMTKMIRRIREKNPGAIIIGNGGAVYAAEMNGALFEHFPSWNWGINWKELRDAVSKSRSPNFTAINVNTDNQDRPNDYKRMRYGLATALAGGAWYSFDRGDWGHDVLWWYDEYLIPIGAARGTTRLIQGGKGTGSVPGVWGRDFEYGMVLLNSSEQSQKIPLSGVYEKIRGQQDPLVNDGSLVSTVTLAPHDGILLLRKSAAQEIRNAAFVNGSFVRVYDSNGTQPKNGFFAQRTDAPSGAIVESSDLDRDGSDDLVIAEKGTVTIRLGSGATRSFRPFGTSYKGRVSLAVQNTNRDAALEIIVGREGAPPEVRIFSASGVELRRWNAYHPKFAGGVRVAAGDIDGDGLREIITAAGPGGGPHVRIWKTDGTVWGGGFFAFNASESGGVNVVVADVDNDGKAEIITGSGQGSLPRVRIFSSRGILKSEISLGKSPATQGIQVTASEIDGDGSAEILVGGLNAF